MLYSIGDVHFKVRNAEETTQEAEEHALVFALKEVFKPRFEKLTEETIFLHILHEVFPSAIRQQARSEHTFANELMAVTEVFKEDRLQSNDVMITKVSFK